MTVGSITPASPCLSTDDTIFVAGHRGLVGSAILRQLKQSGFTRIVTRTHRQLDLTDQQAVRRFFAANRIDHVVLAAARVGGIHANNSYPAEFIRQNLMIQTNVIHEAWAAGVRRLLFLGSSCIYPKHAAQPIRESDLLTGPIESTNAPYAVAKIAGIHMCEAYNRQYGTAYRALMPTNLYGPGDTYDLQNAHVLPALIRKFHLAKLAAAGHWEAVGADEKRYGPIPADVRRWLEAQAGATRPAVTLWGTGQPRREFLHSDDLATAAVFVMGLTDTAFARAVGPGALPFVNVGCGQDFTIAELAAQVAVVVGLPARIRWDADKPDGTPRKLLDVSRLKSLGWAPVIGLAEGLARTYAEYTKGQG